MPTNVPMLEFTPQGVFLPEEQDILNGIFEDLKIAFGTNLNTALTTPQGQLASSMAAIIGDFNDRIAAMVNQFNPVFASGRMQRALGEFYFLDPIAAEPTVLQVNAIGAVGVVIPSGSQIIDPDGVVYQSTNDATIGSSGSVAVQFAALTSGPLPVPASVSISKSIPGWDRADLVSGVVGQAAEGQAAFEERRARSVAINASGTVESIRAAVSNIPGVLDLYVTENVTSSTVNTGVTNYPLLPHSIYVAAVGGDAEEIARAILSRKDVGANYNGNQSIVIQDTENYDPPYPSTTVKFNIPTNTPIFFTVEIADNNLLPSNIAQLVKNAIVNAFSGGDGRQRARIGASIYASRFYGPISAVSENVEILSVLIGKISPGTLTSLTMGIDEAPTVNANNIIVNLV